MTNAVLDQTNIKQAEICFTGESDTAFAASQARPVKVPDTESASSGKPAIEPPAQPLEIEERIDTSGPKTVSSNAEKTGKFRRVLPRYF